MIGGAAHLVNFRGSDTVAGIWMANKFYKSEMAGFSLPAAEHSTITMWGRANEALAYANILEKYKDQPIFACVSDSYDIYNAVSNIWGKELRQKVIDYKGVLVVRPDSGDPATVVVEVLKRLEAAFGATVNKKGYKVIDNGVRVIQGDGINEDSIREILETAVAAGYSATNIAFGMGGALLQKLDRDTLKFAFKCSWAMVDGKSTPVYKDPVTDDGKRSKKGLLDLERMPGNRVATVPVAADQSAMVKVFENGRILRRWTLEEVRKTSETVLSR